MNFHSTNETPRDVLKTASPRKVFGSIRGCFRKKSIKTKSRVFDDARNRFFTRYTGIPDIKEEYSSESELTTWINREEKGRLILALKKFTPTRKEHILRTCLITGILTYSTFFYGAW